MHSLDRLKADGEAALEHMQGDVMAELDQIEAAIIQNPEPILAVLRKLGWLRS
jgi:hypothetical protein